MGKWLEKRERGSNDRFPMDIAFLCGMSREQSQHLTPSFLPCFLLSPRFPPARWPSNWMADARVSLSLSLRPSRARVLVCVHGGLLGCIIVTLGCECMHVCNVRFMCALHMHILYVHLYAQFTCIFHIWICVYVSHVYFVCAFHMNIVLFSHSFSKSKTVIVVIIIVAIAIIGVDAIVFAVIIVVIVAVIVNCCYYCCSYSY